jgi:hypothetical protein
MPVPADPSESWTLPVGRTGAPDAVHDVDLVLVGGVPGAGKTTAIARATDDLSHVRAVDPEHVTWWLRRHLPARVPYRANRWHGHLLHTLRVLVHLLNGPRAGRRLVVHDPGTRQRRRSLFLKVAHLAGWRAVQLYVDVDRSAAQDGQRRRGRVVRSFEEHWASWQHLRPSLDQAAGSPDPAAGPDPAADLAPAADTRPTADPVLLVDRTVAAEVLRRLCLSGSHASADLSAIPGARLLSPAPEATTQS